jgi:hypothetical protein
MPHLFARAAGIVAVTAAVMSVALPAEAGHKKTAKAPTATTTTTTTTTTTATTTAPATPSAAPTGQATVVSSETGFGSGLAGWLALTAPTAWISTVGHAAAGAVAVTASGVNTAATSPTFAVTPGARYSAEAWTKAALTGHKVGVALRFFDASGANISSATQIGQAVSNLVTGWTKTYRVVGFAPANAVTAAVATVSLDSTLGLVDYFDDVTVWKTTGYAAPVAGPLTTNGPAVLDAQGRRVTLHGVQLGGMRATNWNTNTVSTNEIEAAHRWGANFARLPVGENPMVPNDCSYDQSYVDTVDRIVNDVTSRGMVLLLDLHTNAVTDCGDWGNQQSLPDAKAVTFWQTVANRYKSNPLVAFDLYNEPHDITDSVWRNGGTVTSGGVTYQAVGMQKLYDTVRATGATNLVFASGRGWAATYPATAPLTGTTNLVWAVHAYTCPTATPANGGTCKPGPEGALDPSGILGNFATVGTTQPVMVTEFGWPDPSNGDYLANVAAYASSHGWAGWNAFVFNNFTGSQFDLMKDVGALWNPRQGGMAAITAMLGD